MTSPALFVLCLALVCSKTGIALEETADHGKLNTTKLNTNAKTIYNEMDTFNIGNRTNVNSSSNRLFNRVNFVKAQSEMMTNLEIHKQYLARRQAGDMQFQPKVIPPYKVHKRVKRDDDKRCELFKFRDMDQRDIYSPHPTENSSNYYPNLNCDTVINGTDGSIIELSFIDKFRIEYHPECAYDYLEIRDGSRGYASLLGKFCGQQFPQKITTTGPYAWLKFKSDDTIEYEGFHISIDIKQGYKSHVIPEKCYETLEGMHGIIDTEKIDPICKTESAGQALDVLWSIITPPGTKIYLNFTTYYLAKPNDCEENLVQVFGSIVEFDEKLAHYCGSIPNPVTTKGSDGTTGSKDEGNKMHVRLYASKTAKATTKFNATFTAFRTLGKDEKCTAEEFDCQDNTCIASELRCDNYAHCRLKADEDVDNCKGEQESTISKPHIMVILVIFSLILSGMSFVFLFKCIRKLYQDHKIIQEHIRQSCEDRLDHIGGSRLTLDAKRLQRDSEPRASLERENHTNEMYKKQRSFSKHKQSSIDSDYIQDTQLDIDDEPWRREVDNVPVEVENIRVEHNGRTRRSDTSKREESIRSKRKGSEEKKEIRDAAVGVPDTKESGCQTRESLFQTDPPVSSDGSGSNSRGFSTFGYSGTTIVPRSPPAAPSNTSELTIELLSQVPSHQETVKSQKKIPERRPMSTETTRSAPDVIIVSKPIR